MSKAWNSQGSTTVTTFSTPSSSSSSQRQIRNLDSSKYGAKMPRRNLAVTRSTKPDLKTQSAIESALGVNDTAMVTGLEPPSKLEKPQVSLQKTPSPELPTESHRKESGREIVSTAALPPMPTKIDLYRLQEIRTRRRTSEICRVFSRGFCDWGKSCKHIHIFDTLDQVGPTNIYVVSSLLTC
ncbi:hypothetical protein GYMLUDRAFT_541539 [Collybiopsis luxurians FD-317 M1]|nr:hypothetical protein GYMLUDRAFT_541539 [Collybiopsis luxurians FD-317 M1]